MNKIDRLTNIFFQAAEIAAWILLQGWTMLFHFTKQARQARREQRRMRAIKAITAYRRRATKEYNKTGKLPDRNAQRKTLKKLYKAF